MYKNKRVTIEEKDTSVCASYRVLGAQCCGGCGYHSSESILREWCSIHSKSVSRVGFCDNFRPDRECGEKDENHAK